MEEGTIVLLRREWSECLSRPSGHSVPASKADRKGGVVGASAVRREIMQSAREAEAQRRDWSFYWVFPALLSQLDAAFRCI